MGGGMIFAFDRVAALLKRLPAMTRMGSRRRWWWWLLLPALLAGGVPAHAADDVARAKALFQTGVRHFNAGELDQALDAFKKSQELNPRSAETYNNIAAIYHQFGMLDQAEANFQKARQLNPGYELARYNLARLYLTLARQEYEEVLRLTTNPEREKEAHYYIGVLDQVLGESGGDGASPPSATKGGTDDLTGAEAEEVSGGSPLTREAVPERPAPAPAPGALAAEGTSATLFSQAKLAHANGDFARAISDYQQVVRLRPDDSHVYYNLGSALFSDGQYEQALAAFDRSIAIDPASAEVHHFRGATLEKLGRNDEAIEALKRSLATEESYKARWLLGVLYEKAGDYASAVQAFEAVAKAQPDNKKIGDYLEESRMILAMKGGGERPTGPQAPADQDKRAWLEQWRQAWVARDLDAYMKFYSDVFVARGHKGARDKQDWEAEKRKKFARGVVQVEISEVRVDEREGLVIFSFVQHYRRGGYQDHGMKKLFVRDEGGHLRIVSEEWHRL